MDRKAAALSLGIFSIGLGLCELVASRRIASALEAEGREGVIRNLGLRRIGAGATLLKDPGRDGGVAAGAGGDALDLVALGLLAIRSPRNRAIWGAIALVGAVTIADSLLAREAEARPVSSDA